MIKNWKLTLLLGVILNMQGVAQDNFKVYGEHHGDHVNLAWIPTKWPVNATGVIVKRLSNNNWQPISNTEIYPASFIAKDLRNVEPKAAERERLKAKLETIFSSGRGKPVSQEQFLEKLETNPEIGASLAMIFAMDYDLMLLNGFGLIDRAENISETVTYGIFISRDGIADEEPASKITIEQGQIPGIAMTGETKVIGKNSKLRLIWKFSLEEYTEAGIKGFNIFQQQESGETKINNQLIWITSTTEPAILSQTVNFPESGTTYSAVPVSYFNSNGLSSELNFEPGIYTIEIPAPKLASSVVDEMGTLSWQLDHGYDTLITKIELQKSGDNRFMTELELSPDSRSHQIKFITGDTHRYRISLKTKSGKTINSNQAVLDYKPKTSVPKPENLRAKILFDDEGNSIQLEWNYPDNDPKITFRIFTEGPNGEMIYNYSKSKNATSPLTIPVNSYSGTRELFAVQAMDEQRNKSELSNVVEIITPSRDLMSPRVLGIKRQENSLTFNWEYTDSCADLAGFQVFIDNELVNNQKELDPEARVYEITYDEPGMHEIAVKAVSIYGTESSLSRSFNFKVE